VRVVCLTGWSSLVLLHRSVILQRLVTDRAVYALLIILYSAHKPDCVSTKHRSDSECQQTASSLTIIVIDRLRATTTSHQVRRARLFLTVVRLRGTVCLKTFAQNLTPQTFGSFSKLIILVLSSMLDNRVLINVLCNVTVALL